MFKSRIVKLIFKFFLPVLLLFSVVALLLAGYFYKDTFYYLISMVLLLILGGSFLKKESLPTLVLPQINKSLIIKTLKHRSKKIQLSNIKSIVIGKNKLKILYKLLGILIISLILIYLTIYKLPSNSGNYNLLILLFNSFLTYFTKNKILLFLVIIILYVYNFILSRKNKSNINKKLFTNIKQSLFTTITQLVLSIPAYLIIIFVLIFVLSNSIIVVSNYFPKSVGIHTDKNDIKDIINEKSDDFKLVGVSGNPSKTFIANSNILGNKGDFYRLNLIPNFPNLFFNSKNISTPVYLAGNTIYIKELDKDLIQTISPTLVKKLIKKNLSPHYIKDEPNVQIISRQEYLKYREDQINKEIEEISGYIEEAKKLLGSYSYQIGLARNNISILQGYIQENIQIRDSEYNWCVSATYTYYGYYSNYTYRRYTDSYCQSLRDQRNQQNVEYQSEITTNQNNLGYYQSLYSEFKGYLDQFENYKVFIEITKDQTPFELGLFEPEKSVKVVLDSVSEKDIYNFMVTLAHEYMHYTSYVSEESSLPQFFEEGLTEHFARKVISEQLSTDTNLGYPLISKIISEITKKVPLKDLEDIYFNKNTVQLQSLLDNAYGKGFYEDTELYFVLIPLSPNDEALKFANNIMFKIGGNNLEEKDLYSDK